MVKIFAQCFCLIYIFVLLFLANKNNSTTTSNTHVQINSCESGFNNFLIKLDICSGLNSGIYHAYHVAALPMSVGIKSVWRRIASFIVNINNQYYYFDPVTCDRTVRSLFFFFFNKSFFFLVRISHTYMFG